ncbi:MAG: hypothetical protein OEZ39_20125 [Gammaproteobacteria bacterium]|nr:hypothetical protein [Gammaproteobacteria bacterium]MDH5654175.1 hypothetical protein [Gammaproteobacteria bacterium]
MTIVAEDKRGRPATSPQQKWLQNMQTMAWFSFVRNSGVNYKTIRIKFSPVKTSSFTKHYGDRDRQWHRWSNGSGPVKSDVLEIVEQRIPGSQAVYQHGPEGSRFWHVLSAEINVQAELMYYSQPALHGAQRILDSSVLLASPWHRLAYYLLVYKMRLVAMQQPPFPGANQQSHEAAVAAWRKDCRALLEVLEVEQRALYRYGLFRQDILMLLNNTLVKLTKSLSFSTRCKHPDWQRSIVLEMV